MATKSRKKSISRKLFIISFILIPTVHFLIFYVYVNFQGLLMGFYRTDKNVTVWTLDNFRRVFTTLGTADSDLRLAFSNTFKTFGISVAMFPIGLMVSYFLYKKIWFYKGFRVLFYLPNIISGVVVAFVYTSLVSSRGVIAPVFQKIFKLDYVPSLLADSDFANIMIWIHMIWLGFPGSIIILGGTFSRIPTSVLEYAKLDGVGWGRELFQIILPLVWPTISLLVILMFAGMFSASGAVFLLTKGAWGTETLSNWFYMQVFSASVYPGSNTFNYMSAFGLLLTVVACAVSLFCRKVLVKLVPDVEY